METWEHEFHTYRIISGVTKIPRSRGLQVRPARPQLKLEAAEFFIEILEDCYAAGVMGEGEAIDLLRSRGLWTAFDEEQLKLLTQKIEDLKVGLFESWSKSTVRAQIREALNKGRAELARLEHKKHCVDHLTCEGIAAAGRVRYLTGFSLYYADGTALWTSPQGWEMADGVVDDVIEYLISTRLVESDVREICRNDPWRSYWSSRKTAGRGMIDVAAVDLTDEQRYVMMWSNVYDSIRESSDCPDDSIIDDDDMLDGWMIKHKRERENQIAKKRGDEIANTKIRNADEVYIEANTIDDARKIERINDSQARATKAQRLAMLKNRGVVNEMEMPDTWSRFQQESARAFSDNVRGK